MSDTKTFPVRLYADLGRPEEVAFKTLDVLEVTYQTSTQQVQGQSQREFNIPAITLRAYAGVIERMLAGVGTFGLEWQCYAV